MPGRLLASAVFRTISGHGDRHGRGSFEEAAACKQSASA